MSNLSAPEDWLFEAFGALPVLSGVSVSPEKAMTVPAVRCAVQAIAESIGQLPVHTFARGTDGAKERAPDHPVYSLLHDEANPWTPASDFREQMQGDALLHGNGVALIVRANGTPRELHRLAPEATTIKAGPFGEPVYEFRAADNQLSTFAAADVLHIRAASLNGISGESPIKLAREAIGLAIVLEQYAARLFGNGARPSGMLTLKGQGPKALEDARKAFLAAHGSGQSGGTVVMSDGADWKQMTLNSVDAEFMQLRRFAIEEIARVFRVPPSLLMHLEKMTLNNAEETGSQFVTFALMRWIKQWEGEVRLKLFTADERKAGMFAAFLTDDFARADLAKRADAYQKLVAARILNPNEVRALENRAPYKGGDDFLNPNTTAGTPAQVAA